MIISKSIHVAANGIISFFFMTNSPLCVCVCVCVCVCARARVRMRFKGKSIEVATISHASYIPVLWVRFSFLDRAALLIISSRPSGMWLNVAKISEQER